MAVGEYHRLSCFKIKILNIYLKKYQVLSKIYFVYYFKGITEYKSSTLARGMAHVYKEL